MKANKIYAIVLGCVLAFGLVSCVKTAPEYVPGEKDSATCTVSPDITVPLNLQLNGDPIEVTFVRNDANGALDVPVELNTLYDLFSLESNTVSFANGEKEAKAYVNYDYDELNAKDSYDVEVRLASEANASLYKAVAIPFTCVKAWKLIGEGQFYDPITLETDEEYGIAKCDIVQSPDGSPRYRIMAPYADVEQRIKAWGEDCAMATPSEFIEFWVVDEKTKQVKWENFWLTGIWYGGVPGDDIKAYLPSARGSSYAANDKLSCFVEEKVVCLAPYFYIDGKGGFGVNKCYLSMPGGPDLEEWLDEQE